jgi:hypothetical protein
VIVIVVAPDILAVVNFPDPPMSVYVAIFVYIFPLGVNFYFYFDFTGINITVKGPICKKPSNWGHISIYNPPSVSIVFEL